MREKIELAAAEIRKVIVGKDDVIEKILTAVLADGHILLDDVPGVGKTTLAAALGRAVGLVNRRIQFTPDVLPADIVGFSIYDKDSGDFIYRPGLLNGANLVLADEINRASSRTQSALLEAMEERRVTVDGEPHPLEDPFILIATQNNVGAVGTQPLPYAQVDRFLVRLSIGYPDLEAQTQLLRDRQREDPLDRVEPVLSKAELLAMREEVRSVTVKDSILDYISRLTLGSRDHVMTELGISPRGALFLCRTAMAKAWISGRDYVTAADVQDVLPDVWTHRILLKPGAAAEGCTPEQVLRDLLESVAVPDRMAAR